MVPGAAAAASAASAAAASALNTTWRRLGRHYSSSSSSNSGGVDRRLLKSITELYGDDDRARVHDANECALSSSSSSLADAADTVDARDGDRAESSSANVDRFLTKFRFGIVAKRKAATIRLGRERVCVCVCACF